MVNPIRRLRRVSQLPRQSRSYIRLSDLPIIRDHMRSKVQFGEDELEMRAISKGRFPGATLPERIVYQKLVELLGSESAFIFQRSELGGRNFLGGYVLDFVVPVPAPPLAIEVLGDFWHKDETKFADEVRALTLISMGFDYFEIWEHDILRSDEATESLLATALGGRLTGFNRPSY